MMSVPKGYIAIADAKDRLLEALRPEAGDNSRREPDTSAMFPPGGFAPGSAKRRKPGHETLEEFWFSDLHQSRLSAGLDPTLAPPQKPLDEIIEEILFSALHQGALVGWFEHDQQMREIRPSFWTHADLKWQIGLGVADMSIGQTLVRDAQLLLETTAFDLFVTKQVKTRAAPVEPSREATSHIGNEPNASAAVTKRRGAPPGSGAIDDSLLLKRMDSLVESGKSTNAAATEIAAQEGLSSSDIDRLRRKYRAPSS